MISPTEDIIQDLKAGKLVVIMDDEDRENEGDLIGLAENITPEQINFMITEGRGLVCLSLAPEKTKSLGLPLMTQDNGSRYGTRFTLSIEAAEGVTTGISAFERAHTIRIAAAATAKPADIVTPGHIFPIEAHPGGVLARAGHTEASVELAKLSGSEPAAVLCEILREDGHMARLPELVIFAKKHGLKIGTIADLIHYQRRHQAA